MPDFTPLARPYFARLSREAASWTGRTEQVQFNVLSRLLREGGRTRFGREKGLDKARSYEDLLRCLPAPIGYPELRPYVERMIHGERDVLWPGVTRRFAQSSGTSDGKSKFIPVTKDSLRLSHYRGGAFVIASYLSLFPDSRMFSGKSFILGGSFANELTLPRGVKVGDVSACMIDDINPVANLFRVPSKKVALMKDWAEKLPALIEASSRENITNISGVPSWFLTVLKGVLAKTGAANIKEVWPNLEVFFHGGIAMDPYWDEYRRIVGDIRYLNCYNSSEGFFGVQDQPGTESLRLLLDAGTFYEFAPVDGGDIVTAGMVEQGRVYALVITSCNGLWRYALGDTVRIDCVDPLRVSIVGRTKSFINAFGEELMVDNAEKALARVCSEMDCAVANYTAAPVYAEGNHRGRHEWLIEFSREPGDMEEFAERLDKALQDVNSDYQAKRSHGIFLDRLTIVRGRVGVFDAWLASTGKLGGQRKIPRLSNSRHPMDEILKLNSSIP